MTKQQELLEESYTILFEIDQNFHNIFHTLNQNAFSKINDLYNTVMQQEASFRFEKNILNEDKADETSSNFFLATLYLYFIYKIFNERLNGYTKQLKRLAERIIHYTSTISPEIISEVSQKHYWISKDTERIQNDIEYIIDNYDVFTNAAWQYETERFEAFPTLKNYCKYSNKKQVFYKKINDDILKNKDTSIALNMLSLSANIHHPYTLIPKDTPSAILNIKPSKVRCKVHNIESNILILAKQILDIKSTHFPETSLSKIDYEKVFKELLSFDDHILDKYPCISFLLYKTISKMTYHKCKSFFIENVNPPKPFDDNEKFTIYTSQELEKFSFTDFKGAWAQSRIQKMMFFAIDNLTNQKADRKVLENEEWLQPEKQKQLLNEVMSSNDIPAIKSNFDFSTFNDEAFSATETALNLLYNIASFNETGKASDVIQQINFIDEQRSRLFTYPDIKPTAKVLKDDKPESNQKNPKFFDNFCPQSRDNLVKEIKTMSKIDCGFPLPMQVQHFPTNNNKVFARKQNCKLFLETDTACNLRHEEFYRNRYKNMLQTRYIYPARNMATHYSKYTPTESLLEEKNFTDLLNFLYDAKSRLQNEQELRNLKKDLNHYQLGSPSHGHLWLLLKQPLDFIIKDVLTMIASPEYTGKLKDGDVQQIENLETSKEILDILHDVQANYNKTDEYSKKLSQHIHYFKSYHPDLYCLIKDIINQKEYTGTLNNRLLDEMANKMLPSTRIDNLYYTLSEIRSDYPVDNALAKELDLHISAYKKNAIVIPKENASYLIDLFRKTEEFFIQNKDSFVKVLENAFKDNDYDKLYESKNFLGQYLVNLENVDSNTKSSFSKIGLSVYNKTASFSPEEKSVFDTVVDIVFSHINNFTLTKKIESEIENDDPKAIYNSIININYVQNFFYQATGFSQSKIKEQIDNYIPLCKIKVIQQSANATKTILESFKASNKDLEFFDSEKLWEHINLREFDEFNAKANQMKQIIDKYILFYYPKDHNLNYDLFRNEKEKKEYSKFLYKRKAFLEELIKEENIDKLKSILKRIEYFELPDINFDEPPLKYYSDYLKYIESLDVKCKKFDNSEIHQLAQKIHNKINEKRQDAALEYDKKSVDVFKNENTYESFLIKYTKKFLLSTIKYCTESSEVQKTLCKNNKTLLNKNGSLGLNKEEKLSDDIQYPEDFKHTLRQFLNTIFGISNTCTASKSKDYDTINYNDIKEVDINFFDQYNKQILLYLIRVTVELAHVKKIEI